MIAAGSSAAVAIGSNGVCPRRRRPAIVSPPHHQRRPTVTLIREPRNRPPGHGSQGMNERHGDEAVGLHFVEAIEQSPRPPIRGSIRIGTSPGLEHREHKRHEVDARRNEHRQPRARRRPHLPQPGGQPIAVFIKFAKRELPILAGRPSGRQPCGSAIADRARHPPRHRAQSAGDIHCLGSRNLCGHFCSA